MRAEEGGGELQRGRAQELYARLVVLAVVAALLLPAPAAWAQNAAEAQSPADESTAQSAEAESAGEQEPAEERSDRSGQEVVIDTGEAEPAVPDNLAEAAAEGQEPATANVAEGQEAATAQAGETTTTPSPQVTGEGSATQVPEVTQAEPPNAAESRPAATGAENRAEGTTAEEDEVAIPPEPLYQLPSPAELAGSVEGYSEPQLTIQVPPLERAPARPDPDSFFTPQRSYLERRPLPPIEEGETSEERTARSIEDSLKLLDMAMEQRPEEGLQIPLPSGLMTFKASDSFQYDRRNKILTFTGNVELIFADIAIWADVVEVDDGAATAYARGYVAVQQREDIVYCDEAYLNYDTETLELFWVEGNTTGSHLYEPLYFEADRAYGTFDHMILEKAVITTCAPLCGAHRDYEIKADKVHYKRDKSIVMYDVYLFLRDTKVGWVPVLAVPLPKQPRQPEQRESEIQQSYGYNYTDGYFAKFAYTYSTRWVEAASRPLLGVMKMELMSERGTGVGIKQSYYISSLGVGTIEAYYKDDWPEVLRQSPVSLLHNDIFKRKNPYAGEEFELSFGQNLYLTPEVNGEIDLDRTKRVTRRESQQGTLQGRVQDTWNGRFNLGYRRNKTDSSISLSQSIDESHDLDQTSPRRSNRSIQYSFNRQLTKEVSISFKPDYHEVQTGLTALNPVDKYGSVEFSTRYTGLRDTEMEGYSSSLTYRKARIDYDGDSYIEPNENVRDQIPSLQITLPNNLFDDNTYFNSFVIDAERVIQGRRNDPDLSPYEKYSLTVGGSDNYNFSRGANLSSRVNFKQYFYDDGNALYNLSPNLTYRYDSFDWWDFNTSWRMSFWQGARSRRATNDRQGYINNLSYTFNYRDNRYLNGRLSGSYDLENWNFGTISSTFNWDPHKLFGLTHTTSYGPRNNEWEWGSSNIRAAWRSPYVSDDGYRNWVISTSVQFQTDYLKLFKATNWRSTYYKRLGQGWVGGFVADYRINDGVKPAFSKRFLRDTIKAVYMRKVNCCTTWEAIWNRGDLVDNDSIWVTLYLNALPEYPGRFQAYSPYAIHRPRDEEGNVAEGSFFPLEFDAEFAFPSDNLRRDVLTEVLGIEGLNF